jgi:hypothetical protein
MIRVGAKGDVVAVELQDLLFTTVGPTAGAILIEWNIQADSIGPAGLGVSPDWIIESLFAKGSES